MKKRKFVKSGRFFVYILRCLDGTYYTGYTNNLENRLRRHNNGFASKYTRSRLPVKLVWKKEYRYLHYAMSTEYRLKRLNRRQKIILIQGMRLDKVMSKRG